MSAAETPAPWTRRRVLRAGALGTLGWASGCRRLPSKPVPPEAAALHRESLVIDLHVDSFLWVRLFGYDMGRRHENRIPSAPFAWHADLPRLREGGVGAAGFGIVVNPRRARPELVFPLRVLSWWERERGVDAVLHTLDLMRECAARYPAQFALATTAAEVRVARAAGKIAGLACLEGAHGIEGSLDNVQRAYERGLRSIGPVHFQATEAGYPMTVAEFDGRGLPPFGRELIAEMERLGMIVDLAHLNAAGFAEALQVARRPLWVSHAGCAAVHPHRRNLTDEQIRALADRGGVVGIVFEQSYLSEDGANLERALDHIEHALRVGGEDAVAIGSDFDGFITPAVGLEDAAQMPHLTAGLLARGHSPRTIQKILGENALRVIAEVCG